MAISIHPRYRILAIVTAVAIYALIIAGAVVRVSGSGLGCPDWPTCHGTLAPPFDKGVTSIIEYTHRAVATISGIPIFLTGLFAWLNYRRVKWIIVPATIMLPLLVVEIGLGRFVVLSELQPELVVIHLVTALTILACAVTIAVYASQHSGQATATSSVINPDTGLKGTPAQIRRLIITLAALFVVLTIGAMVVASNTSLACPEWPICNTGLGVIITPPPDLSPAIWFHLAHRYSVALFSLWLGWVVYRTLKEQGNIPAMRAWAIVLGVLFALQVSIGATQVLLQKPAWLRAAHLGVAAGVWAALVVLTLLNVFGARRAKDSTA